LTLAFALGPPTGAGAHLSVGALARQGSHLAMLSAEPDTTFPQVDCVGPECDVDEAPAEPAPQPSNSGGGKTIDMRRGRTGEVGSAPAEQRSYGVDPRERTGKPEREASEVANALAEEPHASASTLDFIKPLRSVEELEAALAKAGSQRLVVIKFYARWCKSCKAIKPRFERIATKLSAQCDFYECDYAAHKAYCERSNVRFMPCVHIYKAGKLDTALSLSVQKFNDFAVQLEVEATKVAA